MNDWNLLGGRAETLIARLEALLPEIQGNPDWDAAVAFRWRKQGRTGSIHTVFHPHHITAEALRGIEQQKIWWTGILASSYIAIPPIICCLPAPAGPANRLW